METERTAYDDPSTLHDMCADCRTIGVKLRYDRIAKAAARPAPSLRFENYPREVTKREISIDQATARLAAALYLD
jgi:hypothetical protein